LVLASLSTGRKKARDARRISDVKSLKLALEMYANDFGKYPAASATCNTTVFYGLQALVTGKYIKKIPLDPTAVSPNNCYRYASLNSTVFHLATDLENASSKPTNDMNCSSVVPLVCFTGALTNGFNGSSTAARYDVRN